MLCCVEYRYADSVGIASEPTRTACVQHAERYILHVYIHTYCVLVLHSLELLLQRFALLTLYQGHIPAITCKLCFLICMASAMTVFRLVNTVTDNSSWSAENYVFVLPTLCTKFGKRSLSHGAEPTAWDYLPWDISRLTIYPIVFFTLLFRFYSLCLLLCCSWCMFVFAQHYKFIDDADVESDIVR